MNMKRIVWLFLSAALVAGAMAQALSAEERAQLAALQDRERNARQLNSPKIRTARQNLELAVRSDGDVTYTIGSNATVSLGQMPSAMREYSDAAVAAMSLGYTMGQDAGTLAGALAAERVRADVLTQVADVRTSVALSQAAQTDTINTTLASIAAELRGIVNEATDRANENVGRIPMALDEDCTSNTAGKARFNNATNHLQICSAGNVWITIGSNPESPTEDGSSRARAGKSCLQMQLTLKANGQSTANSLRYMYSPSDPSDIYQVYCHMAENGGGWTLVAMAGRILNNKRSTCRSAGIRLAGTGVPAMLHDVFGQYDPNALSTKQAFSWMRHPRFAHLYKDDSEVMAHSASMNNAVIFPIEDKHRWDNKLLPHIPYMKMRRGRNAQWVTRVGSISNFQYGTRAPGYIGWDFGACTGGGISINSGCNTNQNNWGNYNNGPISHRAMLYWEAQDTSYAANQWWHGKPMNLNQANSHDNSLQDLAFFIREGTHAMPTKNLAF